MSSGFSATEKLREGTLTVAFKFDNTIIDDGPLGVNGTGISVSYATGRVNRSLSLSINPTYVQVSGPVLLGTSAQAYSFAIWIKPTTVNGGTIVHVSSLVNGMGWCIVFRYQDSPVQEIFVPLIIMVIIIHSSVL